MANATPVAETEKKDGHPIIAIIVRPPFVGFSLDVCGTLVRSIQLSSLGAVACAAAAVKGLRWACDKLRELQSGSLRP